MGKELQKDVAISDSPEEIEVERVEPEHTDKAVEVEDAPISETKTDSREAEADSVQNDDPDDAPRKETAGGDSSDEAAADSNGNDRAGENAGQAGDGGAEKRSETPPDDEDNEFSGLDDEDIATVVDSNDDTEEAASNRPSLKPKNEKIAVKPDSSKKQPVTEAEKAGENEPDPRQSAPDDMPAAAQRKSRFNYIIAGVIGALIIAGYILYSSPSIVGVQRPNPQVPSKTPPPGPEALAKSENPGSRETDSAEEGKLQPTIDEAIRLRNKLLEKKEEIYQLKRYYQHGIAELRQWVERKINQEGISSFERALANKQIEYKLRMIHRRQAYIAELEKPYHWIDSGTEKLLFLTRSARIDILMLEVAAGIDLDRHRRHLDAAVQKYQPTAERLAVDPPDENREALRSVWDEIVRRRSGSEPSAAEVQNFEIIEELCSGRYRRLSQLSALTAQAARCLSRMKGAALVLNHVSDLPAPAAEQLSQWPGNWICLNGLRTLSPEAAQYLFQWPGSWISLNGLSQLTPALAENLLKWNGQQLELMGLQPANGSDWQKVLKYLALWETSGGKLFVSAAVRKEMERGLK